MDGRMKIIGRAATGFIAELSHAEMEALSVPGSYGQFAGLGDEVDVISRLRPTIKFEEDALAGPHMVGQLRKMADELERGLAALRAP